MFVGGGSGALYPVDDERQIAICSDVRVGDLYEELLSDPIEGRYVLDDNRVRIKFSGEDAFEVVKGGDLALQGHYLVHLRTIKLNPHSPGVDPDGEYYAIFKQSGNPEVRVELGNITPGVEFPLEVMVLLDNKGGDSWFAVFCDKWGADPVVFEAYQAPIDGKRWLYTETVCGMDGALVEFRTYAGTQAIAKSVDSEQK